MTKLDRIAFATENAAWWFNSAASWERIERITDAPYRHAYHDLGQAGRWLAELMKTGSHHGDPDLEF